jgi:hypothetical protein
MSDFSTRYAVILAQAGIHFDLKNLKNLKNQWIPACARMTVEKLE